MSTRSRAASGFLAVTIVVAAAGGFHLIRGASHSTARTAHTTRRASPLATAAAQTVSVTGAAEGRPLPVGFMGISMGFREITAYGGTDPTAPNQVLAQLLRNLAPGQPLSLRIGGDGTDWTWWPVPRVPRPPGAHFPLNRTWLAVARRLAQAVGMRLILGINLEADSRRVASAEAQALLRGIGRKWIEAFEVGNEAELYGSFPWYKTASGQRVTGRPASYGFANFLGDFGKIAAVLPGVPLAGPATGDPAWIAQLGHFLAVEPRVRVATVHRYPFIHCTSASHISTGQLLSAKASAGLASGVARYVHVAHAHHVSFRIDELNGISCGGERGVSDTFTSALWALQTLFEMARVGVDGVNFHTVRDAINELFGFADSGGHWRGTVRPEYYALMMFAQAAPPGSRLLRISGGSTGPLHVWATRAPSGQIRIVVINEDTHDARLVRVRVPTAQGSAALERLEAPGVAATSGVTLGGQSFGRSTSTGLLAGKPQTATLTRSRSGYVVRMPAASAAMLTLART